MKKRALSFLLTLVMLFSLLPAVTLPAAAYSGGKGTEEEPYLITSKTDLKDLADEVTSGEFYGTRYKYFKLANDIGSDVPFTEMIGSDGTAFCGHFDGGGHTIYVNLTCANTSNKVLALFPVLSSVHEIGDSSGYCGATICNLTVAGTITVDSVVQIGDTCAAAGICAKNEYGVISNCTNLATINVTADKFKNIGGICGYNNNGKIVNCTNSGEIKMAEKINFQNIGGICGRNYKNFFYQNEQTEFGDGVILNCVNTAAITGSKYEYCGGICGSNDDGYLVNCISYAKDDKSKRDCTGISADYIPDGYEANEYRRYVNCYYDTSKYEYGPLISIADKKKDLAYIIN